MFANQKCQTKRSVNVSYTIQFHVLVGESNRDKPAINWFSVVRIEPLHPLRTAAHCYSDNWKKHVLSDLTGESLVMVP